MTSRALLGCEASEGCRQSRLTPCKTWTALVTTFTSVRLLCRAADTLEGGQSMRGVVEGRRSLQTVQLPNQRTLRVRCVWVVSALHHTDSQGDLHRGSAGILQSGLGSA